jgi:predicted nucleic acid-binding protein
MVVGSYLDTSFLFKLYVSESDSPVAIHWFRSFRGPVAISELSDVEMVSALHRKMPVAEAKRIQSIYEEDKLIGVYDRLNIVASTYVLAQELTERYSGPFGLRAMDAIHLAVALEHGHAKFATFDTRLGASANAAGLEIVPARP